MSDAIVKNLNFGSDARSKVYEGIEKLTKAVSSTLGASGLSVILENDKGRPVITKDGVTVANNIFLRDPVENMGATLLKDAARKTVQEAGDGTTTATILTQKMVQEGLKNIASGASPMELKKGMEVGLNFILEKLSSKSISLSGSDIQKVATVSAGGDEEIGSIISKAMDIVT